jgi:hypothetical protein
MVLLIQYRTFLLNILYSIVLLSNLILPSAFAGGNSSGGGSDAAAISYLDYSLPKNENDLALVLSKVETKRKQLSDEKLYSEIKSEFLQAGLDGLKKSTTANEKSKSIC